MTSIITAPDRYFRHQTDLGLLVLRAVIGLTFVMHGGQKLFVFGLAGTAGFMESLGIPIPTLAAAAAIAAELVGGAFLVAGLLTRWTALPLVFTMFVAFWTAHRSGGFFLPEGFEFVLVLGAASAALFFTGAGRWSADAAIARWLARRTAEEPAEPGGAAPERRDA